MSLDSAGVSISTELSNWVTDRGPVWKTSAALNVSEQLLVFCTIALPMSVADGLENPTAVAVRCVPLNSAALASHLRRIIWNSHTSITGDEAR